jgi:hypothetical protein
MQGLKNNLKSPAIIRVRHSIHQPAKINATLFVID